MKEVINTNSYELLETGTYIFTVESVERLEKNGRVSYKWQFSYIQNGQRKLWTKYLWSSQMADILRFTGMSETTQGYFELDYEGIKNKLFKCVIVHETGKDGKIREQITQVDPVTELKPSATVTNPVDIAWEV